MGTQRRMQIYLLVDFNGTSFGKWRSDYQMNFDFFFSQSSTIHQPITGNLHNKIVD